eukprot:g11352.t1
MWSRNFESWSEIPKHESVSRFYSEAWLRGKPVKCKITDRPNDQLLFEGIIWRRLPDRKYAVKFQDGEVLICPRNHIFPTTFSSPVLNADAKNGHLALSKIHWDFSWLTIQNLLTHFCTYP